MSDDSNDPQFDRPDPDRLHRKSGCFIPFRIERQCYDEFMNRLPGLSVDEIVLQDLCRRFRVRRLAVFGSALRGELRPESDLDVLVEFEPEAPIGLRFITLQTELSKIFGRRVDLLTAGFLSPHLRPRVLEEAVPLYEAA
jgi:predicted nucleotidyltransferase